MLKKIVKTLLDPDNNICDNISPQQKQNLDNGTAQANHLLQFCDAVDSKLTVPIITEVMKNTSSILHIKCTDNNGELVMKIVKKSNEYDVYCDGNKIFKNLTAKKMLWEYDALFEGLNKANIQVKCVKVPENIKAEVFMTQDQSGRRTLHKQEGRVHVVPGEDSRTKH